jgi:hypothetical protein
VGAVLSKLASPSEGSRVHAAGEPPLASGPTTAEGLRTVLSEAGEAALATQVRTAAHAEAHGTWRVEIPLQFGRRQVHLDCEFEADRETDGRGGDRRRTGQLHVLVTPAGASPLEARFSWRGEDAISVDVYVDSDGRAAALCAEREALADRLQRAGFTEARVDIWANPARLARWATRRPAALPAGTALDTRA